MVPEARLENGMPQEKGWFVVNARVLAAGVRREGIVYPANDVAIKHEADVEQETTSPAEAYAKYSRPHEGPAPELF